jgi:hypothetical protein
MLNGLDLESAAADGGAEFSRNSVFDGDGEIRIDVSLTADKNHTRVRWSRP